MRAANAEVTYCSQGECWDVNYMGRIVGVIVPVYRCQKRACGVEWAPQIAAYRVNIWHCESRVHLVRGLFAVFMGDHDSKWADGSTGFRVTWHDQTDEPRECAFQRAKFSAKLICETNHDKLAAIIRRKEAQYA